MFRGIGILAFGALSGWGMPVFQVAAVGPSGYTSSATAINATGAVVGNYMSSDGTYRAFLWQGGQSTTLTLPSGALQTWATAISGSGQAGGYIDSFQAPQGVVWNSQGTAVSTAGAYVMGLNGAGDAAGLTIGADGSGSAFVIRNGVTTSLGQPAGGGWSAANAINSSGTAAGTGMDMIGRFRAFTAASNGGNSLLNGLGGQSSYGKAINDAGVVAGHSQDSTGALIAAVWTGTVATRIGTLGGVNSYAYAINAAGNVAGYSDLSGNEGSAAFLYRDGILNNLNSLIAPDSNWQLLAAFGMNDAGQIVGRGRYNGVEQAFLLTPVPAASVALSSVTSVPEPATFLLLAPVLLGILALRVRW